MLILSAGTFGQAVASSLSQAWQRESTTAVEQLALTTPLDELEPRIAAHDFVAVASWRPYVDIYRALDELCHRLGKTWFIAEIEGQTMNCGPLIQPGSGRGCYHCYLARGDAYERAGERARALRHAYQRDHQLGNPGFLGPMVSIASASLLQAARGLSGPGQFRRLDVLTGTVLESVLVPLHDCPRCRPQAADYDPTRRSLQDMLPELAKVLS